jgi:DNA repair protein RecN (Recombination protein N)
VQLRDRLKSVYIELVDIAAEASRERDSIEGDPGRLKVLEDTLDKLYALSHKHRLNSAVELIDLRESLRSKLDHFEGLTDKIESLTKELESAQKALLQLAKTLHSGRIQAAGLLEKNVKEKLALMKMTDAKLQFVFSVTEELNQFGQTGVELLFQANKGLDAQPLEKAASGGELSRLMLALKATTASFLSLPSLILDEVDTGVSGEVAARMADVMRGMSGEMQLIAISHLPQVAGKAQHHYKVFKETIGEQTFTRLISLTEAQRVEELAGMLSGENITDSARKHAKELLQD